MLQSVFLMHIVAKILGWFIVIQLCASDGFIFIVILQSDEKKIYQKNIIVLCVHVIKDKLHFLQIKLNYSYCIYQLSTPYLTHYIVLYNLGLLLCVHCIAFN